MIAVHTKPTAHFRRWDDAQDEELKRRCAAGQTLKEIAAVLGRTQEACRNRANALGIACRS